MIAKVKKRPAPDDLPPVEYSEVRLSDAEMVRLTGASRSTVRRWRLGLVRPPRAVVRLAAAIYTGDLRMIFGPRFEGIALHGGLLYLPGFKYGFRPEELRAWRIRVSEGLNREWENRRLLATLAAREAEIESLEHQVDFYRRQAAVDADSVQAKKSPLCGRALVCC